MHIHLVKARYGSHRLVYVVNPDTDYKVTSRILAVLKNQVGCLIIIKPDYIRSPALISCSST
jgi:hypothetical protein